jgi:opacity protein-like surface antigen
MPFARVSVIAVALTLLCNSCMADRPDWDPFVRADVAVFDDYDSDVEVTGFSSDTTSTDYDSIRVAGGAAHFEDGRPTLRLEGFLGRATFAGRTGVDDSDVTELGLGGRWFVPIASVTVRPYVSLHGVVSLGSTAAGVDPGNEAAFAIGTGLEFEIASGIALDASVDYALPFVDSDSDPEGLEVGTGGLALRLGVVFDVSY